METINRHVAIVKPKQPYLDWANAVPGPPANATLEFLREDCTAWLLPDDDDSEEFLRENFDKIFEHELWAWTQVEDQFPKGRTFEMFKGWFDVEVHSMVFDLAEGRIKTG